MDGKPDGILEDERRAVRTAENTGGQRILSMVTMNTHTHIYTFFNLLCTAYFGNYGLNFFLVFLLCFFSGKHEKGHTKSYSSLSVWGMDESHKVWMD